MIISTYLNTNSFEKYFKNEIRSENVIIIYKYTHSRDISIRFRYVMHVFLGSMLQRASVNLIMHFKEC